MTYPQNGTPPFERPETAKSGAREWEGALKEFAREFIRTPVAMFGMAVSCAGVVWALWAQMFLVAGRVGRWPLWFLAPVAILVWLSFYAVVATLFLRYEPVCGAKRIVRRIAWCFVALTASGVVPYLWEPLLGIIAARIANKLYMLACLAISARIALPEETRALWDRFRAMPFVRARWRLVCLGAAVIGSVVATESVFYAASGLPMEQFPKLEAISLLLNAIVMLGLMFLLLAATNRLIFAMTVVYTLYFSLTACNIAKVHHMHASVQPLDFIYIQDLMLVFTDFFGRGTVIGLAVGGMLWVAGLVLIWRRWRLRMPRAKRLGIAFVCVVVLSALLGSIGSSFGRTALERLGVKSRQWNSVVSTCMNGTVLEMALELPYAAIHKPEGYSEREIVRSVHAHYGHRTQGTLQGERTETVNLIIYPVESMMDPLDLGYGFTADPIPTVRANRRTHTGGYAIVPEAFGGSANTEFELLTGMTMYFLPERSCPYKQYIKQDIPSLPWLLKERGYRVSAVMSDNPSLYNRHAVFRHLGFDETTWLSRGSGVRLDVAGRCVADDVLVDAVIAESRKPGPQFIFAFPNSTHGPYDYPQYLGADLDILSPMKLNTRNELKTYVNAIHTADTAIAKLLSAMQRSERKTVVVILGDHVPPLTGQGGIYSPAGGAEGMDVNRLRGRHKVPLIIWTNFDSPRKDLECGVNFLPAHILAAMGVRPVGFLALNKAFGSQLSVLSRYVQTTDGERFARNAAPARLGGLIRDYELVQYDLLLGKQYSVKPLREAEGL